MLWVSQLGWDLTMILLPYTQTGMAHPAEVNAVSLLHGVICNFICINAVFN